ncbi:MAG: cytochrome c-type biogenesis CcmF C-terminal domain-containing protein [Anaerolineae bacterium]
MLKIWNFILVGLFFGLAIFGTFLTRSGVVSSVHSFAQSPLGPYFLGFITFILLVFLGLLVMRWDELRSPNKLESPVSRETAFLLNNLVLLAIIFAVFWGTMFPMISEIVVGDKITVGPPYFNQITIPLFGVLLVLMGIAPMTSWGRATLRKLVRNLAKPFIVSGVITLALFLLGLHGPALIAYAIIVFVLAVHVDEFYSGSRVYRAATGANWLQALVATVRRNRRRYGGYIVHLGILVIAIGVVASNVFQLDRQATLRKGETLTVGEFNVQYQDMQGLAFPDRDVTVALVRVSQNGKDLGILMPSQDLYRATNQPQTEVAIRRSPTEDLYIVLGGWEAKGETATFKVFVNPLVSWVWGGGLVVVLGILVAAWPEGRRRPSVARVPEAVPAK